MKSKFYLTDKIFDFKIKIKEHNKKTINKINELRGIGRNFRKKCH